MNRQLHDSTQASVLRQHIRGWFDQSLGRSLQAIEANRLRSVWPHFHGNMAVQLGQIGSMDLMDACAAPRRYLLDMPGFNPPSLTIPVYGEMEALPFDSRSIDLALLPHTLDFACDPHQVLREVQRVLTPEGHVLILGFNPMSLWGLWRLLLRRSGSPPWNGHFIHLLRIKDWLKLLGFDLVQGSMVYYRPPLRSEGVMDRLYFLDKIGDRWWPMAAAVYMVVAKKRVAAMTPLRPVWRRQPLLTNPLVRPAGKVVSFRRDRADDQGG